MSIFHTALVDRVELVDIPSTQWMACKSVLRAIANHANENEADLAWPGVELLMLETGASERVIVRTTTLLAKHGWITKKRRPGTSNLYRLNMAKLRSHQIERGETRAVYMAKHLPGMEFPGEDLSGAATSGLTGRSTARRRAGQRVDQRTRRSGVMNTPDRQDKHADLAGPSRQIGDLTIRERPLNRQAAGAGTSAENRTSQTAGLPALSLTTTGPTAGARLLKNLRLRVPVTEQLIQQNQTKVTELLTTWPETALAAHLEREAGGDRVVSPLGMLVFVIRQTDAYRRPGPARPVSSRPPWCGSDGSGGTVPCNPQTRMREPLNGNPSRCPECHPLSPSTIQASSGDDQNGREQGGAAAS